MTRNPSGSARSSGWDGSPPDAQIAESAGVMAAPTAEAATCGSSSSGAMMLPDAGGIHGTARVIVVSASAADGQEFRLQAPFRISSTVVAPRQPLRQGGCTPDTGVLTLQHERGLVDEVLA